MQNSDKQAFIRVVTGRRRGNRLCRSPVMQRVFHSTADSNGLAILYFSPDVLSHIADGRGHYFKPNISTHLISCHKEASNA